MTSDSTLSRRRLLRNAAAGLALSPAVAAFAQEMRVYRPFRMGIQSYSLRGYKLDEALAKTRGLGLRFWEGYEGHVPLTNDPAKIQELKAKLEAANVRLLAHGVHGFGTDQAKNRAIFENAKAMGIRTLAADPSLEALDQLEKLVEEFEINIAIHNHGPGHRWDKLQQVVDALKGRHQRIGASADLGHFLRSGEESVKVVETLGNRIYSVHLKDVKDKTKFTILGQGDMDLVGVLKALKALNYRHVLALEYEENPENLIADIEACLAAVRSALQKI